MQGSEVKIPMMVDLEEVVVLRVGLPQATSPKSSGVWRGGLAQQSCGVFKDEARAQMIECQFADSSNRQQTNTKQSQTPASQQAQEPGSQRTRGRIDIRRDTYLC